MLDRLRARDPEHFESTCQRLIEAATPPAARGVAAYLEQWKQTRG